MIAIKPDDRRLAYWGWGLWLIALGVVLLVILKIQPGKRTVTNNYADPAILWWEAKDLYTNSVNGFLYFPQSAILYTPFAFVPHAVGEALWRMLGTALLASAVYRLSRAAAGAAWPAVFLLTTLLSIAAAAGSMRNGQMNIPLGALMIHAGVDIIQKRWSRSAALLVLALALKPLALVLILLFGVLYPREMSWRLAVGVLVMVLAPFVVQPNVVQLDPEYVLRQYDLCAYKLLRAGNAGQEFFPADVSGMLRAFHAEPAERVMLAIRFLVSLVTLGLSAMALWAWRARWGAILVLSFGAAYLMAFNPRTENNSYIILVPMVGAMAWTMLIVEKRFIEGGVVAAMGLCLSWAQMVTWGETHWFRPLVTILYMLYLSYLTVFRDAPAVGGEDAEVPATPATEAAPAKEPV